MTNDIYIGEPHEPNPCDGGPAYPYCEVMCRVAMQHVDKNAQWVEFVPLFDLGVLSFVRISPTKMELEMELTEAIKKMVGRDQKKRFATFPQVYKHLKALLLVMGKWKG